MIGRANAARMLLAASCLLVLASSLNATTYSWTGANSGDWTDAGNWDANGVPVDIVAGGNLELDGSADEIVINAPASLNPVPTSNIPTFGGTTSNGQDTPEIHVLCATQSVSVAGWGGQGCTHYSGQWYTSVGDGDTNNGLAELNYNMTVNQINRHPDGDMVFTVERDGTLNVSNPGATLDFAYNNNRCVNFTVGGTLSFSKAVQLDGYYSGNYFLLTNAGASVTADFGGSFANIAAVEAEIGDGLSFRKGGVLPESLSLAATDNGDGTFTVEALAPLRVVLTNTTIQSSASVGTTISEVSMYEDGSLTNGFTFSLVATDDYEAFTVVGSELRTAVTMTNAFYVITLHGTNASSSRSTNTEYQVNVTFPAVGITNDWTGAVDADWDNAYNWAYRRMPPQPNPDLARIGVLSGGLVRFNALGSPNPVPTSNIPYLINVDGSYRTPAIALLYGGDLTFTGSTENRGYSGAGTSTVGDDNAGNGTVTLTYSDMINLSRDPGSVTKTWIVNSDGTLVFSSTSTYLTATDRWAVFIINGGTVMLGGDMESDWTSAANNYVDLREPLSSFTASFGSGIPDLATLNANTGSGLTFRSSTGQDIVTADNDDGTFTVSVPPAPGTMFLFE